MPKAKQTATQLGQFRQTFTTPEHRQAITVGRGFIVEDTLKQLETSASKQSKHHFLFIGPRGIGKSHLLSLIEDGITSDQSLAKSYVVARFPEESHRTLSFADFLLGLCDILQEILPDETEWHTLYETYHTEDENTKIVDALVPAIRRANEKHNRTTLVILENLNELFTRQIKSKQDIGAFRKFFMDANGCLLLATSPLHFDAITSVDEPFYDFFDVQLLEHLSEEETIELVRKNLVWEDNAQSKKLLASFDTELRPKILALYRLTAGNPRLTVMLYELIAHDSITEVRQQLQVLLDRITPFYQDRLNDLPPQERAVLETMARMRDTAKTPAAITERMRLKQNQTSTLLKRLSDAHYIHSFANPEDKRSRIYAIRERFFDIWLAMNVSRASQKRVPYLLDFFALVYPSLEERNRKRAELIAKNDSNAVESLAYLSEIGQVEEKQQAKYGLAKKLTEHGKKGDALNYLRESYTLAGEKPYENYLDDIEAMIECWDHHREGNLEAFADRISSMSEGLTYKTWSETKIIFLQDHITHLKDVKGRALIRLRLAALLTQLARWDNAEILLREALVESENNLELRARVLNDLAQLLQETNRIQEAEPLMRQALEIDQAAFGKKHPTVAIRLNNLAGLLHDTNRIKEAEPLMRQALEIDQAALGKQHPKVAIRLNNLAGLLYDTNRIKEAEPLMRQALEIDQATFGKQHPTVAVDLNNLAQLLKATNRMKEAEPLMRQALEIDQAALGKQHPTVATNLNNLAGLLHDTNRIKEAEPLIRQALEILTNSYHETGYLSSRYRNSYDYYRTILSRQKLPEQEIEIKLAPYKEILEVAN